jgi:hypothetical protein
MAEGAFFGRISSLGYVRDRLPVVFGEVDVESLYPLLSATCSETPPHRNGTSNIKLPEER